MVCFKSNTGQDIRCTDTVVHILSSEMNLTIDDLDFILYLKKTGENGDTNTVIDCGSVILNDLK